jgi:hypothetical protein
MRRRLTPEQASDVYRTLMWNELSLHKQDLKRIFFSGPENKEDASFIRYCIALVIGEIDHRNDESRKLEEELFAKES